MEGHTPLPAKKCVDYILPAKKMLPAIYATWKNITLAWREEKIFTATRRLDAPLDCWMWMIDVVD